MSNYTVLLPMLGGEYLFEQIFELSEEMSLGYEDVLFGVFNNLVLKHLGFIKEANEIVDSCFTKAAMTTQRKDFEILIQIASDLYSGYLLDVIVPGTVVVSVKHNENTLTIECTVNEKRY